MTESYVPNEANVAEGEADLPDLSRVPSIDADSHIEEHEGIFDYLDKAFEHRRPRIVDIGDMIKHRPTRNKAWIIDGEMRPKMQGYNSSCHASPPTSDYGKLKPVSIGIQTLSDVPAYLAALDSINLDISVLYPTLFLQPLSRDPFFEAALVGAYNSYMAEQCGKAPDRLKWGGMLPVRLPEMALAEVKRIKALGASSCMMLPTAGNVLLHDRRFDPVYAYLEEQQLPLCIHVGWSHDGIQDSCAEPPTSFILNFEMSMMMGFYSIIGGGVLDRFPRLKVAFLEAGIGWYPAILSRMDHWAETPAAEVWLSQKKPSNYLRENQVYFTVEGDEDDLPSFVQFAGEDRIIGSADFPHVHYSGGRLSKAFDEIKTRGDLTATVKEKILGRNSIAFYGLT